jgi:negative regulator of sigma E activity
MANQPLTPHPTGPSTVETFIADRQVFWTRFTRFIVAAVVVLAVILIGMAIFLV